MANLRLMMKFLDGRLSWTEKHWLYYGPPSGSFPSVSPAANLSLANSSANALVAARTLCLPLSTKIVGAVLSYDDSERDGQVQVFTGLSQPGFATATLDPELCVGIDGASNFDFIGYQSHFYLSPTVVGAVADQLYTGLGGFAAPLNSYLQTLMGVGTSYPWGWKAVLKQPFGVLPPFGGSQYPLVNGAIPPTFAMVNGVPTLTVTTQSIPINFSNVSIVKIAGVRQARGAQPKINGRWNLAGVAGNTWVLTRKYVNPLSTPTSLGYLGGGYLIPTYYVILPYTGLQPAPTLEKHDRGGSLGLPRGRSKGRPANV